MDKSSTLPATFKTPIATLVLLLSALLVGCGGGATPDTASPQQQAATQAAPETTHPAIDAYYQMRQSTRDLYNGNRQSPGISSQSLPVFFNTVMYGSFPDPQKADANNVHLSDWTGIAWHELRELPFLAQDENFPIGLVTGSYGCGENGQSGSYAVESKTIDWQDEPIDYAQFDHFHFSVTYNDCQRAPDAPVFNGGVEAFVSTVRPYDPQTTVIDRSKILIFNVILVFNDVYVARKDAQIKLNGAIARPLTTFCDEDSHEYLTLLAENQNTGESVLMDDFLHGWYAGKQGLANSNCPVKTALPNVIDGTLLHSEYGSVSIRTTDNGSPVNPHEPLLLELRAADSTAVIEDTQIWPSNSPIQAARLGDAVKVTLTQGVAESTQYYAFLKAAVLKGAFTDIEDFDSDGLPNSWEQIYGLDPQSDADATIDIDNDKMSNIDEYRLLGDPSSQRHVGLARDLIAGMSLTGLNKADNRFMIDARVYTHSGAILDFDNDALYEISANQPGTWTHIPDHCHVSDTENNLVCSSKTNVGPDEHGNYAMQFVTRLTVGFAAATDDTVEVTTTVHDSGVDFWLDNNTYSTSIILR